MLNISGESEGPFVSLISLLRGKNFKQDNLEGAHKTFFKYETPIKKKSLF